LALELNFLCSLQNPGFKLQDLIFFMQTHTKKKHEKKPPTGLLKNSHNWQTHMPRQLGIEPSNLQRSVDVVWRQRVKEQLI
jgi:hypothetical protein